MMEKKSNIEEEKKERKEKREEGERHRGKSR